MENNMSNLNAVALAEFSAPEEFTSNYLEDTVGDIAKYEVTDTSLLVTYQGTEFKLTTKTDKYGYPAFSARTAPTEQDMENVAAFMDMVGSFLTRNWTGC